MPTRSSSPLATHAALRATAAFAPARAVGALVVLAVALALGVAGCSARAPSEASTPAPTSTGGGEHEAASEVVYDEEAPSAAFSADGASAEAQPSPAPDDAESLTDAYEALLGAESDYDALMDRGSADCPEAERLVQRICYLAERVCGLEGVDRPDPNDADAPARCDEARARCASSEARLERACSR